MLNHTIELLNERYNDGLDQLIERQVEAATVITELRPAYFGEKGPSKEQLVELAKKLDKLLIYGGHVFIKASFEMLGKVIDAFNDSCFRFKNILVIPGKAEVLDTTCTCHLNKFWKSGESYIAFFTHGTGRPFNFTKLLNPELTNQYPSNWTTYFDGTLIEAYEILMKISCGHQDIILDPFMFDASVGVAAINSDRHYIGIEGTHLYKLCARRLDETFE